MSKHDFYADPTVFDHWQRNFEEWLTAHARKIRPWSWFLLFSGLAMVFVLVASSVFLHLLLNKLGMQASPTWNQSMAQGVIVMVALLASQNLLRQAREALPRGTPWPRCIQRFLGRVTAGRDAGPIAAPVQPYLPPPAPVTEPGPQAFFADVRAAGVNVQIAKALFSAGIRSPQHLRALEDADLLQVRGVGPATVRKLRNHFRNG